MKKNREDWSDKNVQRSDSVLFGDSKQIDSSECDQNKSKLNDQVNSMRKVNSLQITHEIFICPDIFRTSFMHSSLVKAEDP